MGPASSIESPKYQFLAVFNIIFSNLGIYLFIIKCLVLIVTLVVLKSFMAFQFYHDVGQKMCCVNTKKLEIEIFLTN